MLVLSSSNRSEELPDLNQEVRPKVPAISADASPDNTDDESPESPHHEALPSSSKLTDSKGDPRSLNLKKRLKEKIQESQKRLEDKKYHKKWMEIRIGRLTM